MHDLETGLGIGRDTPIMVMEAAGGLMTIGTALAKPVHTVLSGPAGGVVAGAHFAGLVGARNVISMDIGGTSTDISLIRNGQPETTRQAKDWSSPHSLSDNRHQRHRRRRRVNRLDRRWRSLARWSY